MKLPASDKEREHSAGLVKIQVPDPDFYVDFNKNKV
jgi:hypothetical protein